MLTRRLVRSELALRVGLCRCWCIRSNTFSKPCLYILCGLRIYCSITDAEDGQHHVSAVPDTQKMANQFGGILQGRGRFMNEKSCHLPDCSTNEFLRKKACFAKKNLAQFEPRNPDQRFSWAVAQPSSLLVSSDGRVTAVARCCCWVRCPDHDEFFRFLSR